MKKNISINISGIVFYIEEDGYELLRNYLNTINNYFSAYEDSAEIIADIESRIAEIFLAKLKEGEQVITASDVQHLMTTMGSIQDFEALEEEPPKSSQKEEEEANNTYEQPPPSPNIKRLYRDTKRKIVGGVAAGIANFFSLDPLWIRLILIVLLFDIFITYSIGILVIIGYIICWIIIPPSDTIEEDRKAKKMFRDPDNRVLGGVSGGLAAYFGIDATLIRLLFVISMFIGGAGILIYLVLWIITPEAKSITDKIQMQGDPITLANIENNIKKSLQVDDGEEESLLMKILLFPFRLIAIVFSKLGTVLGPLLLFLIDAIRIISGICVILIAVVLLAALFMLAGIYFNVIGSVFLFPNVITDFPFEIINESFPPLLFIAVFFALFLPLLGLIFTGISILAKRRIVSTTIGWSLFALWLISLTGLAFTLPLTIKSFSSEGSQRIVKTFNLDDKIAVLELNETGLDDYQATTLRLLGHNDPNYKLVQKFYARGSSRQNALMNAEMVSYTIDLNDSIFTFDSNIQFKDNAIFRAQELDMILYIPLNKPFVMKENLKYILKNTLYNSGYDEDQMEGNTWIYTEEGLICQTCPIGKKQGSSDPINNNFSRGTETTITRNISDFDNLDINGFCEIIVTKKDQYSVQLSGDRQILDITKATKTGNTLKIRQSPTNKTGFLNPQLKIVIAMPTLEAVKFSGVTQAYVDGFDGNSMEIKLSGSSKSEFNIKMNDVRLDLSGASKLTMTGQSNYLEAELSGACRLLAEEFKVENAVIKASGISSATVNAFRSLESNTSGLSKIENKYQEADAEVF